MMGAVQLQLDCPDQAAATHIQTAIINYVAGLPPATTANYDPPTVIRKGAGYRVYAGSWYTDWTQAQNVFNQVQTLWNSGQYKNDVLAGSMEWWYQTRADEWDGTNPWLLDSSEVAVLARGDQYQRAIKA